MWDRAAPSFHERTAIGRGGVALTPGRAVVRDSNVQIGAVTIAGRRRELDARALIDDTAAYYERTHAGAGQPAWAERSTSVRSPGTW